MGAPSAHGPRGRDEDPARHSGEPDDEAAPWEPVVTRPDPVSDEEWLAWAERLDPDDLDPDRYLDEDDLWDPHELDQAEVAAMGDDPDPAGVAQVLAAQATAAQARRRGPGQPGSARSLPPGSSSAAAEFGSGQPLDVMPAGPSLAVFADRAAGPDDSYTGASDDELIGLICAWDRLEGHMAARKLAAITLLSRRRPVIEPSASGHPAGSAPDDFAADELAHALAESRGTAQGLLTLSEALDGRLPGTKALLRDGVITLAKAKIITAKTVLLTKKEARKVEARVLSRAGRLTPGGLRHAADRAVMEVAPEKAKARREHAAKTARVERWGEDSGNGALAGRELSPAEVLAADQRITWWAGQLKKAGLDGDLDQLRARALIDLILSRDSRLGHGTAGSPGSSPIPAGFTGNVNLTVPLVTILGLADRPGELAGFGPVDPWLARDLATAAAAGPKTRWCVTVTDPEGHADGHDCARPIPKSHSKLEKQGKRGRSGPAPPPPGSGFAFTRTSRDGPPGGYGTWILRIPGSGPDLMVELQPLTTENCDHRFEVRGHDPGAKLRHLAQIRHATCTGPVCRRPAATCDYEHNIPYEAGGRTCLCNGGPKCRHDHKLKQHPRWKVDQLPGGTFRWTTPSGRTYDTEPTRYPI